MANTVQIANWLSNGLGGQSMYMLYLAAQQRIPATLSITADTGSETDRVCSTGERMSAPDFFARYVVPYAQAHNIEAVLVRAKDRTGADLPPLIDALRATSFNGGRLPSMSVPLYTNDRGQGRLRQTCTSKWKVAAIQQEARRRGITLLRSAIGFHYYESDRIKAQWRGTEGGYDIYKPYTNRRGRLVTVKWLEHYYPLIDLRLNRTQIQHKLGEIDLPYLTTTECDHCPHQDYPRWAAHSAEVIDEMAQIEEQWSGKLFLTDRRVPLKEALNAMRTEHEERQRQGQLFEADFGCETGAYCGI